MKKTRLLFSLLLSFCFIFQSVVLAQNVSYNSESSTTDKYFEIAKNLDIFTTLFKEVNTYYVDDINPNQLIKVAIEQMLKDLDPYTNYIPEEDIEDYRTMTTGQYGGIGALVGTRNGKTLILMPYEGYPAYEADLKIGDQIIEIDGVVVDDDKNTDDVSKLLKGQANTEVEIKIQRFGETEPRIMTLKRKNIKVDNVSFHGMLSENVGYIKLTDFTAGASREVKNALEEVQKQGANKLVLDLRGNPGGLLNEAINICNLFIDKNLEVVSTKGKIKEWNKTYRALSNPFDTKIPIIVLTDGNSASASEIVSGVIQDYDRGVLIGERTFGKGLVQTTRPLSFNSQMKVTTAKYYIPSGRCIQAIDYSHKDENGKAIKFPDSLKTEFKTVNSQRTVYDGNGLKPDIEIEHPDWSPITISLFNKSLIFDYATEYYYTHPEITSPEEFVLSEEEYQAFISWLSDKDYDYTTDVEKTIQELEEVAKEEKYYDLIQSQLEDLRQQVSHSKEVDVQTFKEEIKEELELEIIARYYLEEGKTKATLLSDIDIQRSLELFDNMPEYEAILAGN